MAGLLNLYRRVLSIGAIVRSSTSKASNRFVRQFINSNANRLVQGVSLVVAVLILFSSFVHLSHHVPSPADTSLHSLADVAPLEAHAPSGHVDEDHEECRLCVATPIGQPASTTIPDARPFRHVAEFSEHIILPPRRPPRV